ncbi:hypothetical protein [Paraburkholderia caribensis]|uniref:hypothetical protein n=1 Tax=Paraburkholderia caribensis TaxID=75105 RepID=UPI0011DF71BF|nr:hypothetical protein [Paraburkholderia caribensis]
MHIKALRMPSSVDDRFICDIEGKFVHVVLRRGDGVSCLADLDGFDSFDEIRVATLGEARDPAMQLSHALMDASDGDVIVLYCRVESLRYLLLQFLDPGKTYH